jgi:phosphocarrier protein
LHEPSAAESGTLVRQFTIINKKGLHARASAKFVQTVDRFDAEVTVTRGGETVGGRSIMGLLTLGAAQGTSVTISAEGPEAAACLAAVERLLSERFGEDE